MLNLRPIDNKFYLSGGWVDVPKDAEWLAFHHFRAVLDLQFTPSDFTASSYHYIKETLEEADIKYFAVPMNDSFDNNLDSLFETTYSQLKDWDELYKGNRDKILIKCGVGVSRSVAVLINYLCIRDRLTYSEAKSKVRAVDDYNYGGLPISIHPELEIYLRLKYPEPFSAFGEKE